MYGSNLPLLISVSLLLTKKTTKKHSLADTQLYQFDQPISAAVNVPVKKWGLLKVAKDFIQRPPPVPSALPPARHLTVWKDASCARLVSKPTLHLQSTLRAFPAIYPLLSIRATLSTPR